MYHFYKGSAITAISSKENNLCVKIKIIFNHEYYMNLITPHLKKVSAVVLFSVGLFATAQASAATACDSATTQADINKCTAAELKMKIAS